MTATLTAPPAAPPSLTVRDLLDRVGDVPLYRVCFDPYPGNATEADVLEIHAKTQRLFELVDGVLVEKATSMAASCLTASLAAAVVGWAMPRNVGMTLGPNGMLRFGANLVRLPDVSLIPWDRVPGRQPSLDESILTLRPELAVEVLAPGNTASETCVKLCEYFEVGTPLVWIVDPVTRTVETFAGPNSWKLLQQTDTLDGGSVLPGFTLSLARLFRSLDPH